MPLTYGGGIKTMEHANRLFECGVEKICLQSEVYTRPEFVTQLANRFGNQSIVVSTDIKKNIFGKSKLFFSKEGKISNSPWVQYLKKIEQLGAGEILLNAVDRDGTFSGPDLELISIAANEISIPIISLGGVSCLEDIKAALIAGASAVAAGSFFVYHGPHRAVLITYPQSKEIECL
jgi:cyclase